MVQSSINIDRLLKLRLVVARFGEMDIARWWNTKSQLGRLGTAALRRGFPRTHYFAQARSVFAVAAHRCTEVFDPPDCVTLWRLTARLEEEFDARWEHWLDHAATWEAFFQKMEGLNTNNDLLGSLRALEGISDHETEMATRLRRSAEGRAVLVPGEFTGSDADIVQLALGFARGEVAALAVPYQRLPGPKSEEYHSDCCAKEHSPPKPTNCSPHGTKTPHWKEILNRVSKENSTLTRGAVKFVPRCIGDFKVFPQPNSWSTWLFLGCHWKNGALACFYGSVFMNLSLETS